MRQRRLLAIAALFAVSAFAESARSGPTNGVPEVLLSKLKTGVNVCRWFCYTGGSPGDAHYGEYLRDADFAAFKRLKVSFVRLCLAPDDVYDKGKAKASTMPFVDSAIAKFEKAGIAVIFDLHDNGQLKLDQPGQDNSGLITFWEEIARRYKGKHETTMVFEIVNEPVFNENPEVWFKLQEQAVKAIRKIDPKRTIMVVGTSWSGVDAFVQMKTLPEKNLIYTFHCYDPFQFSHQGAGWVGEEPRDFKGVPFPTSPELMKPVMEKNNPKFAGTLKWYGEQKFDEAYLRGRIKKAMDWGKQNGVPVLLGEFGVYPPVAPAESRARWFKAMRKVCIELDVPNAIWGYDDALGLGRSLDKDGKLVLDPVVLDSFFGVKR